MMETIDEIGYAALLYIHRNFFARAIIDFPDKPLNSVFAPSVLSTYRSASALLRLMRETYHKLTLILFRLWPTWLLCFSSAVCVFLPEWSDIS